MVGLDAPLGLTEASFSKYPVQARGLVVGHLDVLNGLPVILVALLLRQAISYDWQFPAERAELEGQLKMLSGARDAKLTEALGRFDKLPLTEELKRADWVREPERFVERLTAYLWTVKAMDDFRAAALDYGRLAAGVNQGESKGSRLCVVLIGAGSSGSETSPAKLLSKLRPYGTYFARTDTKDATAHAVEAVVARAKAGPGAYEHWYVDGGTALPGVGGLTTISYNALLPLRQALLAKVHTARISGTVGPEDLRSMLADMRPGDFGAVGGQADPVLGRFQLEVLTEGSGTQIFSTTFVQWTARELLRRAQPETLLVRYGLRQKEKPMDDLLLASTGAEELDPRGSLIDAEMGAYYTWINLQRLAGAETNRFVVCVEGGSSALAIGPAMARGAVSQQSCDLKQVLKWLT